ncbi:MAG: mechanosensitive ion channel family protein [Bacilli bacterium]|nr:mechanosensitive ion channel family protein [Bacilli bacterium]
MKEWLNKIEEFINSVPLLRMAIELVILTVIVFGISFLILKLAKKSIALSQKKFGEVGKKRAETLFKLVKSMSRYITIPVYIILMLPIFGLDPTAVFASAGLLGFVLGFALQDFLKDIVSGIFIVFERIYEVEDYVTIANTFTGTVRSISLKATTLESWTGEIYTINNRDVKDVTNYSNASFAIVVNQIKVSKDTDLNYFKEIFSKEIANIMLSFKGVLIDEPLVKGVDKMDENGYVIEFHSKVKTLEQYQYRRDFNYYLINLCNRHNIKLPHEMVEVHHG